MYYLEHNHEDTFNRSFFLRPNALTLGLPWQAKSQIRDPLTGKRYSLDADLTAPPSGGTQYVVHLFAPSSEVHKWRAGGQLCDIEFFYLENGVVAEKLSADTFLIVLKRDITK